MNIIETIKDLVSQYPGIKRICNAVHVDFTDGETENYGLSSTGDKLLAEDCIGNQIRQHTFVFYSVHQSFSDYDRMSNSGILLEFAYWLESQSKNNISFDAKIGDKTVKCLLTKITTENGMLYSVPNEELNSMVMYQIQIIVTYETEMEE